MSQPSDESYSSSPASSPTSGEDRLRRLVEARYPEDPELQNHVLESARSAGTVDRVLSGELVLPHPEDARRDLERVRRQQQRQGG